ncbi:MAG: hypothetical protein CL824_03475 [Crocinitomicaceae bacterium]|nr:hypothetical protein [Crocinitomicaceae bacterium]|tara:strand:+ start:281 stop:1069 length:789 start_codon:yes stop_codon:yes gene_type:complete
MKTILRKIKSFFLKEKYPLLSRDEYLRLFNEIKNEKSQEVNRIEQLNGFFIEKNWIDNLALHTQIVKKKSKLNYHHGRLLYSVLRNYIKENPELKLINILETGTARGFSSMCMSKALNDSKKIGKVYTIDIIPNNQKIFWNCIDDWDGKKTRIDLLNKWKKELENIVFLTGDCQTVLKNFHLERVNFAFLDAQHDYESIMNEFNFIFKRQQKGDLIIFDDVNFIEFPEISKFINELKSKKIYDINIVSSSKNRSYCLAKKNK